MILCLHFRLQDQETRRDHERGWPPPPEKAGYFVVLDVAVVLEAEVEIAAGLVVLVVAAVAEALVVAAVVAESRQGTKTSYLKSGLGHVKGVWDLRA